jgi:hypothetical protein
MALDSKKSNFIVEKPNKRDRSDSDEFDSNITDYRKPGYDNRMKYRDTLENIKRNHQNYEILKKLKSTNLSNDKKLDIIEKYNLLNKSYTYKPLSGGLMNDWNNIF